MSTRQVDGWLDGFLELTDNTEPPRMFKLWTGISTVAAVLQRKCYLSWGRETFYPNLYIILVGPPAARKGTALKEGKNLLNKIGVTFSADETSRQKLITSLKESAAAEQGPDGKLNYHASMTIFSSELTVFLGYDAKDMLAMLCKWFDCEDRFIYDTHGRGREEIPNVWTNLIGATTPAQLQASLPEGAVGSGFTSRVVFVYEEDKEKVVIKPEIFASDIELEERLLVDLGEIRNIYGEFQLEPQAEAMYESWRMKAEKKNPFFESRLDYYVQRRPTHLFKLSMIYSACRGGDMVVTCQDLQKAIWTLEETEKKMPQVFAGVGANPLAGIQTKIQQLVQQKKNVAMSEIYSRYSNDASHAQIGEAINMLSGMGFCVMDVVNKKVVYKGDE